jgi:hypothetical protein
VRKQVKKCPTTEEPFDYTMEKNYFFHMGADLNPFIYL